MANAGRKNRAARGSRKEAEKMDGMLTASHSCATVGVRAVSAVV